MARPLGITMSEVKGTNKNIELTVFQDKISTRLPWLSCWAKYQSKKQQIAPFQGRFDNCNFTHQAHMPWDRVSSLKWSARLRHSQKFTMKIKASRISSCPIISKDIEPLYINNMPLQEEESI